MQDCGTKGTYQIFIGKIAKDLHWTTQSSLHLLGNKTPRCGAGLSTVANERGEGFVFPFKVLFQGTPCNSQGSPDCSCL